MAHMPLANAEEARAATATRSHLNGNGAQRILWWCWRREVLLVVLCWRRRYGYI
jgi:hypothetical protein